MVGWGDVDAAVLDRLAVVDVAGRQPAVPAQDVGQGAGPGGRHMEDHEHGRREAGGQGGGQADERLHAAGRGADDHDVVVGHGDPLSAGWSGLERRVCPATWDPDGRRPPDAAIMRVRRFVVHERGTLRAAAALSGSARWETAVNDETFLRDLHAARDRAGRLRRRARARSRRIDDVAREVIANRPRRSSG
jgi:hypothetical protein